MSGAISFLNGFRKRVCGSALRPDSRLKNRIKAGIEMIRIVLKRRNFGHSVSIAFLLLRLLLFNAGEKGAR